MLSDGKTLQVGAQGLGGRRVFGLCRVINPNTLRCGRRFLLLTAWVKVVTVVLLSARCRDEPPYAFLHRLRGRLDRAVGPGSERLRRST